MKIFVAGATGVLGTAATKALVAEGHDVTGIARNDAKAALLSRLGATPVRVDLFDEAAVKAAVDGHDVVCNLATHIPRASRAALPGAWDENNRIRSEGSRILSRAAADAGAARYIQESIAFVYPDSGDRWLTEDDRVELPGYARSTLDAEEAAQRFGETGGAWVVLRFAFFYGPGSHHVDDYVRSVRRRIAPAFGGDSYVSSIHTDDAGSAVAAALRAPSGVFLVGDDEPVTRREYFELLAAALGVAPPRIPPRALGRLGGSMAAPLMRSNRIANTRFKEATGWRPRYPSVREGWPAVVAARRA